MHRAFSLTVFVLSCWSTAFAGRQPPIDLDQLIVESGAIVEARVRVVDPHAGAAQPLTRVDYTVERALGFDYPTAGHFTLPEGFEADGTVHAHYAGPPGFVPGETYLLFLRRAPWRISPVTHWRDGALRLLTLSGRAIYVDATGRCVSDLRDRVAFGPRVVDPPPVPGRGGLWSAHPPTPSAVGDCLAAAELRFRLRLRMRQLDWRPGPTPSAPSGPVGVHFTAEIP